MSNAHLTDFRASRTLVESLIPSQDNMSQPSVVATYYLSCRSRFEPPNMFCFSKTFGGFSEAQRSKISLLILQASGGGFSRYPSSLTRSRFQNAQETVFQPNQSGALIRYNGRVRLLTLNVWQGRLERVLLKHIETMNVDFACMQELWTTTVCLAVSSVRIKKSERAQNLRTSFSHQSPP